MNYVVLICARGGSKGLKNKNLLDFDGKPLIAHTISNAINSSLFEDVVVSTDSQEIAKVAREYGANVPFIRPKNLATDNSSELLSWKHAINEYDNSSHLFVSLPCTSPLRIYKEVSNMIELYKNKKYDLVLGITKSNHSPDFNMVYKDSNNTLEIMNNQKSKIERRQDSNQCFLVTTYAYITSIDYIKNTKNIFNGKIGGYEVSKSQSIDIDDIHDFNYALYLHMENKNND